MPSDSEPRTEAGRALLSIGDEFRFARPEYAVREAVLAIEAEAARLALEDVAERVRGLRDEDRTAVGEPDPNRDDGAWRYAQWLREDAVLALFSTKEDGS